MSIPLLNSFCRLAATSANKVPRPSHYSIATATGSKRSSADSDSLLCHVRLRRTSRFGFGCMSGCEHGEIKFALHNTHVTPHPPLSRSPFCPSLGDADRVRLRESVNSPLEKANSYFRQRTYFTHARPAFSAGVQTMRARICSAISCAMFARVVYLRLRGAAKPSIFALPRTARTCHAWLARLTRARRRWFGRRTARVLLADFWYFSSQKSTIKEKLFYDFFSGRTMFDPCLGDAKQRTSCIA